MHVGGVSRGHGLDLTRVLVLALALVMFGGAVKQASATTLPLDLRFERVSLEQGLSQASVLCGMQDTQGFLWFGTYDGLNRYDGYTFKVYRKGAARGSLSDNVVRALVLDSQGTMWVGGSLGLDRHDRETDTFVNYRHDPNDAHSLLDNEVNALFVDSRGVLWVGTALGLNAMDQGEGREGRFTRYVPMSENPHSLLGTRVTAIAEGPDGDIWVGTEAGVSRLDRETGTFTRFAHDPYNPRSLAEGNVRSILPLDEHTVWVGISQNGLVRLDPKSGGCVHYFPGRWVMSLFKDSRDILWIGAEIGLVRHLGREGGTDRFKIYTNSPYDPTSLGHDDVYTIFEDASGILWVGTYGNGLNKMIPAVQEFGLLRRKPWETPTLSDQQVASVLLDSKDRLWVGTTYGGLNKVDRDTGHMEHFQPVPGDPDSFPAQEIRHMLQDEAGFIWLGTSDAGVLRLDPETGEWRQFAKVDDDPHSLSHNNVFSLYDDGKGTLWVGMSKGGLNRLDKATGKVKRYQNREGDPTSLSHNRVRAILEQKGHLWAGTGKGLNRMDMENGVFTHWRHDPKDLATLSDDRVTALLPGNSEDTLWVGTHNGLNQFNIEQQTFTRFTMEQGYAFANESIACMLKDDQGRLWLGTFKGISCFDPKTGEVRNFLPEDGIQGYQFLDNSAFLSHGGEAFFGGLDGLTSFHPERITRSPHRPQVVLTGFRVMNKPASLSENVTSMKSVRLSYRDLFFSFTFSGLDYVNPAKNRYAYMLEGFDADWVQAEEGHSATYTNINPGNYVFRVRAANSDGVWNEDGLSVAVVITPPFWRTTWFRVLMVLAVLGAIVLFVQWRLRAAVLRERELQRLVEERTEQLKRTYGQLDGILKHSPTAIDLKDEAGKYLLRNPKSEEFFPGADPQDGAPEQDIEALLTSREREAWSTGRSAAMELGIRGRTLMLTHFLLRDDRGTPYALCNIAMDITERKQAEREQRESETRYRTLVQNFPEGCVALFDREMRITLADGLELHSLGWRSEDLTGKTMDAIFPQEVGEVMAEHFRLCLQGLAGDFEVRFQGRGYEMRTVPILGEGGAVSAGMVVAHNVSKRLAAERARRESEKLYRGIAELSPDAILVHGIQGIHGIQGEQGVLFANAAARKLLNGDHWPLEGRSLFDFVEGVDAARLQRLFEQARETGQATGLTEIEVTSGADRRLSLEVATVPITFENVPALLTIGRDVTEKKALQSEAIRTAQLASLGELAAGVAHEINNPINGVINFAELIRDDPRKRLTYADLPERIIKEGERIAAIVRTLLSFARNQDEGAMPVPMSEVLADALRLTRNQLEKDGILLTVQVDDDVPWVCAKAHEIQQVCINLLNNARSALNSRYPEAHPDKKLEIFLEKSQSRGEEVVRLVFHDHGVGIDPEVMKRIFEPFFSTKPRNEGTGLGLAISHKIVTEHGGRLVYDSEPGSYTSAVVELPRFRGAQG